MSVDLTPRQTSFNFGAVINAKSCDARHADGSGTRTSLPFSSRKQLTGSSHPDGSALVLGDGMRFDIEIAGPRIPKRHFAVYIRCKSVRALAPEPCRR